MRRRFVILPAGVVLLVLISGALTAHTAGIVVPPTHAGVTKVPVSIERGHKMRQEGPFGETETDSSSNGHFRDQLMVSDSHDPITFVVTSPCKYLSVSPQGLVSTEGGTPPPGVYTVSGTDENSVHAIGNWSYTLTVTGESDSVKLSKP